MKLQRKRALGNCCGKLSFSEQGNVTAYSRRSSFGCIGCGLLRRFAPRNENGFRCFPHQTKCILKRKSMSLRASAHTGVAIPSTFRNPWGIATPACGLVRDDISKLNDNFPFFTPREKTEPVFTGSAGGFLMPRSFWRPCGFWASSQRFRPRSSCGWSSSRAWALPSSHAGQWRYGRGCTAPHSAGRRIP